MLVVGSLAVYILQVRQAGWRPKKESVLHLKFILEEFPLLSESSVFFY